MHSPAALAHTTPADEAAAARRQEQLRARLILNEPAPATADLAAIAGVDVAYDENAGVVAAAAVLLDLGSLAVTAEATAAGPVAFPYVPGLLAYRELPTVLEAVSRLPRAPDLIVCDGYGLAHPRRFGLACHLGVLTGLRTIGVAKTPFAFEYTPPGPKRGDTSPLLAAPALARACESDTDAGRQGTVEGGREGRTEEVGRALRTRAGVKPVFVSVGHRMALDAACTTTLRLAPDYRLPETTRAADRLCRRALAQAVASGAAAVGPA